MYQDGSILHLQFHDFHPLREADLISESLRQWMIVDTSLLLTLQPYDITQTDFLPRKPTDLGLSVVELRKRLLVFEVHLTIVLQKTELSLVNNHPLLFDIPSRVPHRCYHLLLLLLSSSLLFVHLLQFHQIPISVYIVIEYEKWLAHH
jgi:hypothetical protein